MSDIETKKAAVEEARGRYTKLEEDLAVDLVRVRALPDKIVAALALRDPCADTLADELQRVRERVPLLTAATSRASEETRVAHKAYCDAYLPVFVEQARPLVERVSRLGDEFHAAIDEYRVMQREYMALVRASSYWNPIAPAIDQQAPPPLPALGRAARVLMDAVAQDV